MFRATIESSEGGVDKNLDYILKNQKQAPVIPTRPTSTQRETENHVCHSCMVRYTCPMDQKILEREAMRLPVRDRALLADALLQSLDDDAARSVQLAWAAEAEDRIEAYRRGELSAVDGPSSFKELRSRYRA